MERAGAVLRRLHADLVISKQRLEKVNGIELVRIKREQANQTLCFSSRPFVLCGLPVRRLPEGQLLYERRNGHFVLQVTGHPEFGVPFGQDRIVPIFLAHSSESSVQRSFLGTDGFQGRAKVIHRSRFNFLREAQIWYNRKTDQPVLSDEFENVIVLSDEFFQEITGHPIPTDLDAVRVLATAPAVLDLFMWLSYRCFSSKGEESVPIFGTYGLAAQLGNVEYARPRRFREKLEQWLKTIRAMWPECPARVNDKRNAFVCPASYRDSSTRRFRCLRLTRIALSLFPACH
jgi:hypothetical protein